MPATTKKKTTSKRLSKTVLTELLKRSPSRKLPLLALRKYGYTNRPQMMRLIEENPNSFYYERLSANSHAYVGLLYIEEIKNKRKYTPNDGAHISITIRNGPIDPKGERFPHVVDVSSSGSPNQLPTFQFTAEDYSEIFSKLNKALSQHFGHTGADPLFVR